MDKVLCNVARRHGRRPRGHARAKGLVQGIPRLSSRDALHVAVMEAAAIQQVLSFDADYDAVPGLTRIFR